MTNAYGVALWACKGSASYTVVRSTKELAEAWAAEKIESEPGFWDPESTIYTEILLNNMAGLDEALAFDDIVSAMGSEDPAILSEDYAHFRGIGEKQEWIEEYHRFRDGDYIYCQGSNDYIPLNKYTRKYLNEPGYTKETFKDGKMVIDHDAYLPHDMTVHGDRK